MTYLTTNRLSSIAQRLTDRDRDIVREVGRLRLLSHSQVRRLCFAVGDRAGTTGLRVGQRRLRQLVELGVLARLDRRVGGVRAGSEGFVYSLGPAGQKLLRRWQGETTGKVRAVHEPGDRFTAHTLACSELFVALMQAQQAGGLELLEHQAEPTCWRTRVGPYGQPLSLRPDGFVRLGVGSRELFWFVEIDRATESLTAIRRQGRAYLDYYASGAAEVMPRVAWLTPDGRRADGLGAALHQLGGVSRQLFVAAPQDAAVALLSGGSS